MKAQFDNINISAVSSAIPRNSVDLRELPEFSVDSEFERVIKTTGISNVRIAPDEITTSDLCYEAAISLFKSEDIDPSTIDGLLFVSQTGDYILPQTSIILQDRLKLKESTFCMDIPVGCPGYIYGLFTAANLLQSCCKRVLVLAGDTIGRKVNDLDRSSRMVFGDAATATLVEVGINSLSCEMYVDGKGYDKIIIPAGGARVPLSDSTKSVEEVESGNFRSQEDIFMDGMGVFNFVISKVPKQVKGMCAEAEIDVVNIDLFLFHQANRFIVNYLQKVLKINPEKAPVLVEGYGNTGPASIPLLLSVLGNDLKKTSKLTNTFLSGFGVGLSWGGIITSFENTKFIEPVEV